MTYRATPELRFCLKMTNQRDPYDPSPYVTPATVLQQKWVCDGAPDEWRDVPHVVDESISSAFRDQGLSR